jgi:hypothetical protein
MYRLAVMPSASNVLLDEGIGVTIVGVTIVRVTAMGVIAIGVKLEDFEDILYAC